ncbi:MAG: protein-tyrosine-phosphatase [Pricia sp.]
MIHSPPSLFQKIESLIQNLDLESIPEERKVALQSLIDFIRSKNLENKHIRINFICTHNSRRSHLSQIWAQTMSHYFKLDKVSCYSGATEATSLFPMVTETLTKQGFDVQKLSQDSNPVYAIKYAENEPPVIGFSKKMDDKFNPQSGFAAVMTCDSANEACPFVPGAEQRIPITFEDPKAFDDTPQQAEKYAERSFQIATELKYVFSNI